MPFRQNISTSCWFRSRKSIMLKLNEIGSFPRGLGICFCWATISFMTRRLPLREVMIVTSCSTPMLRRVHTLCARNGWRVNQFKATTQLVACEFFEKFEKSGLSKRQRYRGSWEIGLKKILEFDNLMGSWPLSKMKVHESGIWEEPPLDLPILNQRFFTFQHLKLPGKKKTPLKWLWRKISKNRPLHFLGPNFGCLVNPGNTKKIITRSPFIEVFFF